jgi:hypothetical protein
VYVCFPRLLSLSPTIWARSAWFIMIFNEYIGIYHGNSWVCIWKIMGYQKPEIFFADMQKPATTVEFLPWLRLRLSISDPFHLLQHSFADVSKVIFTKGAFSMIFSLFLHYHTQHGCTTLLPHIVERRSFVSKCFVNLCRGKCLVQRLEDLWPVIVAEDWQNTTSQEQGLAWRHVLEHPTMSHRKSWQVPSDPLDFVQPAACEKDWEK